MHTVNLRLVTIIVEHVLEQRIIADLRRLGARGYTVSEVHGEGTRGVHASAWQGANLKFETLVPEVVADRILEHIAAAYFHDYAVVAYVTTVEVVRSAKFG